MPKNKLAETKILVLKKPKKKREAQSAEITLRIGEQCGKADALLMQYFKRKKKLSKEEEKKLELRLKRLNKMVERTFRRELSIGDKSSQFRLEAMEKVANQLILKTDLLERRGYVSEGFLHKCFRIIGNK